MDSFIKRTATKKEIRHLLKTYSAGSKYNNLMLINQVGFHFVFEEFASDAIIITGNTITEPEYINMLWNTYKNLRTDYIVISITNDSREDLRLFVEANPQFEQIQFSNLENVYPKDKLFSLVKTKDREELINGVLVLNNDKIIENIRLSVDDDNYQLVLEIFPYLFD